jgi:hypothetical protein
MSTISTRTQAIGGQLYVLLFLLSSLLFLFLPVVHSSATAEGATANPEATPTPKTTCPEVSVSCPGNSVPKGTKLVFSADIANPISGATPTYQWTVNPKSLTPLSTTEQSITIDTASADIGSPVTATVTVDRLAGNCPPQTKTSCAFTVTEAETVAVKLSETYGDSPETEWERQANKAAEVQKKNPQNFVYLVAHDAGLTARRRADRSDDWSIRGFNDEVHWKAVSYYRDSQARATQKPEPPTLPGAQGDSPAMALAKRVKEYLVSKGVDRDHIIISSGEPRFQVTVEIFVGPSGARLPSVSVNPGQPPVREEDIEVFWSVLTQEAVGDNFGTRVRKQYYVIQVSIINNSGAAFELLGLGFSLRGAVTLPSGSRVPSEDYRLVRGTVLEEKNAGSRNRALKVITEAGSVATGFVPFFKVSSHRANFSQFINILSNPVRAGYELFFPDQTLDHLIRLDDAAWRDGAGSVTSVADHSQIRTYVFFPKDFLGLNKIDRNNPQVVRRNLSDLVLVGSATQHIKSIIKTQP